MEVVEVVERGGQCGRGRGIEWKGWHLWSWPRGLAYMQQWKCVPWTNLVLRVAVLGFVREG
jgi:hypothetical protein